MNPSSTRELWAKLAAAGLTVGARPETEKAETPWYGRLMLGVAGLIAAGFLLGFLGAAFDFAFRSKPASLTVGLMAVAAAYAVFRVAPRNDFTSMFALAVSIAGQVLAISGIFGLLDRHLTGSLPWGAVAALEAGLAVAMPNFIHRVGSACAAGLALVYAFEMSGVAVGVVAAAVAVVWLNETRLGRFHAMVTPIGYGLTLAFVQIEGAALFTHAVAMTFGARASGAGPRVGETFVLAVLLVSVGVLLKRAGWALAEPRALFALFAAAAIGAASFQAPGIAGGLMIALLGFANGDVVLVGLAIAALLFYVSSYYYLLEATLMLKAGVLLATGVVLLTMRWLVLRAVVPNGGRDA